ncbi:hypothetical protein B0J18DRAFT_417259 [Chaetomium sp. MPI-SDFR-AT-0129]|nr:hypothetical protein B0J18DRAFT_417259 [Chaetomium sp. MPI-SDFR-AT-0129]
MPVQPNSGIPLSHLPNEAGYKLLELPPELLELLEGQDPPRLTLHPSTSAALLKTPLKTYSLRQKNTSNALILLAPTTTTTIGIPTTAAPDTDGNDGADKDPSPIARAGISTIATVHETVELVPEAEAAAAPAAKARGKWHEKFGRGR